MWFYAILLGVGVLISYVFLLPYLRFRSMVRHLKASQFKTLVRPYIPFLGYYIYKQLQKHKKDKIAYNIAKADQVQGYDCLVENMGLQPLIVLYNKRLIKALGNQMSAFQKGDQFNIFKMVIGAGLVFSQGQNHKERRRVISEVFNYDYLNSIAQQINLSIKKQLQESSGQKLEVLGLISAITSSIVITSFFGLDKLDLKINDKPFFKFILNFFQQAFQQSFNLIYILTKKPTRKFQHDFRLMQQATKDFIKTFLANMNQVKGRKYLLQLLYEKIKLDQNQKIEYLMDQFKTFLFAGTDTSSHLISFCLHKLIYYPELADKIRQEIRNVDLQNVNISVGKNCVKLNSFIKECQRMFGPLNGTLLRQAKYDVALESITVPKGCYIFCDSQIYHFSQSLYQQPQLFKPERWEQNQVSDDGFGLMNFGIGSRNCIGQHLALFETRLIIMHVLKYFEMRGQSNFNPVLTLKGFPYFRDKFCIELEQRADVKA